MAECARDGCERPARARGFCDTHYRQLLHPPTGAGHGGIEPLDAIIYKVRVRTRDGGSQPYYYSLPEQAFARAARERRAGRLLFFGEYHLDNDRTV